MQLLIPRERDDEYICKRTHTRKSPSIADDRCHTKFRHSIPRCLWQMDGKHPNQSSMENGFCGEFPNVTMMITRDDGRRKRETEKKKKRKKEKKIRKVVGTEIHRIYRSLNLAPKFYHGDF